MKIESAERKGGDAEAMKAKAQELATVAMKLGQAIYEKEQAAAASPEAEAPKADDGVVADDAERADAHAGGDDRVRADERAGMHAQERLRGAQTERANEGVGVRGRPPSLRGAPARAEVKTHPRPASAIRHPRARAGARARECHQNACAPNRSSAAPLP